MNEIRNWFSSHKAIEEMNRLHGLKPWEAEAAAGFPAGARLLDIGCGTGREAFALHAMGFRVTGVDISEAAIEMARRNVPGAVFHVTDGENLPFEDAAFDVAIVWAQTFGLVHGEEARRRFLGECGRVLRPGGTLSFSAHDREFQQVHFAEYLRGSRFYPFADSEIHYDSYMIEELRSKAERAGFRVLACGRGEAADGTVLHCLCIPNLR